MAKSKQSAKAAAERHAQKHDVERMSWSAAYADFLAGVAWARRQGRKKAK